MNAEMRLVPARTKIGFTDRDRVMCAPGLGSHVASFLHIRDQCNLRCCSRDCHEYQLIQTPTRLCVIPSIIDDKLDPLLAAILRAMFFPKGDTASFGAVGRDALFWFCAFVGRQLSQGEDEWMAEQVWTLDPNLEEPSITLQQYLLKLLTFSVDSDGHAGNIGYVNTSCLNRSAMDAFDYGYALVRGNTNKPLYSTLIDMRFSGIGKNADANQRSHFHGIWRRIVGNKGYFACRKCRADLLLSSADSRKTHLLLLLNGKQEFEKSPMGRTTLAPKFQTPSMISKQPLVDAYVAILLSKDYAGRAAIDENLIWVRKLISKDLVSDKTLFAALVGAHLENLRERMPGITSLGFGRDIPFPCSPMFCDGRQMHQNTSHFILQFMRASGVTVSNQRIETVNVRMCEYGSDPVPATHRRVYTAFSDFFCDIDPFKGIDPVKTRAVLVDIYKTAKTEFELFTRGDYYEFCPWVDSVELLRFWTQLEARKLASDRTSDLMSERTSDRMSERTSDRTSEGTSERMSEQGGGGSK
jgi:hypothetical protein